MRAVAMGLALGLVAIGAPAAHAGAEQDKTFARANKAYGSAKYADARRDYEALIREGVRHEDLYYNLGNTYYRMNQLGRAIWAFEKALRVEPDHKEAKHNLKIARDAVAAKVKDKVVGASRVSRWRRMVAWFSVGGATTWFLLLWWLAFGAVVTVLLLRNGVLRSLLIALAGVVGAVAIFFGTITYQRIDMAEHSRSAIVLPEQVTVREAPRSIATESFKVHAGLRVEVAARQEDWIKIRLANGLEGWVRAGSVGEL